MKLVHDETCACWGFCMMGIKHEDAFMHGGAFSTVRFMHNRG